MRLTWQDTVSCGAECKVMKWNNVGGIHWRALKWARGHTKCDSAGPSGSPRHLCLMRAFERIRNLFLPLSVGGGFQCWFLSGRDPLFSSSTCGLGGSAWTGARHLTNSGVRNVFSGNQRRKKSSCWLCLAGFLVIYHYGNKLLSS